MDETIRDIIDADRIAREEVEKIRSERFHIHMIIDEQKAVINEKFKQAAQGEFEKHKQRLVDERLQLELESEQAYNQGKERLHKLYEEKEEQWVADIVERCLQA